LGADASATPGSVRVALGTGGDPPSRTAGRTGCTVSDPVAASARRGDDGAGGGTAAVVAAGLVICAGPAGVTALLGGDVVRGFRSTSMTPPDGAGTTAPPVATGAGAAEAAVSPPETVRRRVTTAPSFPNGAAGAPFTDTSSAPASPE